MFYRARLSWADVSGLFFTGGWVMASVPEPCRDGPMERQSHDEQQAAEAFRVVDMSVLDAEAARFEVGEHGFDAPATAVFQGLQITRFGRHGDDPGFGVTRIMDDADIGPRPLAGQFDILQIEDALGRAGFGRRFGVAVDHHEVAFQAEPVVPSPLLAPADQ